jgi:hypothetical protein
MSFQPNARVYLDESFFELEGRGKLLFNLSAVIIPIQHEEKLLKRWRALQAKILDQIYLNYPFGYPLFQKSGLQYPKIHAVEMCQGQSYYRKYKKGHEPPDDKQYWKNHLVWLQEAFEIQVGFSLPVIVIGGDYHAHPRGLTDAIERNLTVQGRQLRGIQETLSEMRRLEMSPYTWALPQIAFLIQSELERRNWKAEFVCEDGEDLRGFRVSEVFSALHQTQLLNNLAPPSFRSGHTEAGLQIADIHAYCKMQVQGRTMGFIPDTAKTRFLANLANHYTEKQEHLTQPIRRLTEPQKLARVALVSEFITKNSKGPQETRDLLWLELQQSIRRVATQMYEEQTAHDLLLIARNDS